MSGHESGQFRYCRIDVEYRRNWTGPDRQDLHLVIGLGDSGDKIPEIELAVGTM